MINHRKILNNTNLFQPMEGYDWNLLLISSEFAFNTYRNKWFRVADFIKDDILIKERISFQDIFNEVMNNKFTPNYVKDEILFNLVELQKLDSTHV